MAFVQLLGAAAFIVASAALGTALLMRWIRTRQWPELTIGLAFLVGGAAGNIGWAIHGALAQEGASVALVQRMALVAVALGGVGSIAAGAGIGLIFRPGSRWPWGVLAAIAAVLLVAWVGFGVLDPSRTSPWLWLALVTNGSVYAWAGVETAILHDVLKRRAALGLASPLMASRAAMWSLASWATVVLVAIAVVGRALYGVEAVPPAVPVLQSACGLVSAVAIWLGFFPPESYQRRVLSAAGTG